MGWVQDGLGTRLAIYVDCSLAEEKGVWQAGLGD